MVKFTPDKQLRELRNVALSAIENLEYYLKDDVDSKESNLVFSKEDARALLRIYGRLRTYVDFINSEYNNLFYNLKVDTFLQKIESLVAKEEE